MLVPSGNPGGSRGESQRRDRMKKSPAAKYVLFLLKAAVTAGLIWLIVHNIDVGDTVDRVGGIPFWVLPASLLLLLGQFLLATWRWRIVMRQFEHGLPYATAFRFFFEGMFFNQALPSTVGGDGIRMYRSYRAGLPLETAINSVILDRVLGLASLVLLVALAQPFFYQRVEAAGPRLAFTATFIFALFGLCGLLLLTRIPERYRRWSIARGLVALSRAARRAVTRPKVLLPVVSLSLVGHVFTVAVFYLLACSLDLPVTFLDCLVLVPSVLLLATIPISVAGWGLREGAMVAAFGLIGVPAGGAAAVSVLFGVGLIFLSLPGGLLWFVGSDRRVADVAALSQGGGRPV